MSILIWIGKSLLILVIFHFIVPTVVHDLTRNSWAKLPVLLLSAVGAGVFMAWLKYAPYLLFPIWLLFTNGTLQAMKENRFEKEADMTMNKPVFYISSYSYVIVACLLAWFFQVEVSADGVNGPWIPLWRKLLGST